LGNPTPTLRHLSTLTGKKYMSQAKDAAALNPDRIEAGFLRYPFS